MTEPNPYAPPEASLDGAIPDGVVPSLWNPNAAANWSLILTPIFGAYLHMRNWEALGHPERARQSRRWIIGMVVYYVAVVVVGAMAPDAVALDGLSRVAGFVMLLAWYFTLGRPHAKFVAERHGNTYPRRGWAKPMSVAVGLLVAYILVAAIAGALAASA